MGLRKLPRPYSTASRLERPAATRAFAVVVGLASASYFVALCVNSFIQARPLVASLSPPAAAVVWAFEHVSLRRPNDDDADVVGRPELVRLD